MRSHSVLTHFIVLLVFWQTSSARTSSRNGQGSANVTLVLNGTLSGEPLNHYPVTVVLGSSADTGNLQVNFFAPYLGDDALQRLHVFIANEDKHITELELNKEKGSSSKTKLLVRLYWAPFNKLRVLDTFTVTSQVIDKIWSGTASLPVAFLPPKPSLCSAAVAHQLKGDTHWDSFYSITNAGIAIPDLMVLPRYKKINSSILSNETSYSSEWKAD